MDEESAEGHFRFKPNLLEKTRESFENLHEISQKDFPNLEETQRLFEEQFQNAIR